MPRKIAGCGKPILRAAWIYRHHCVYFVLRDEADLDRLESRGCGKLSCGLCQFLQRFQLAHRLIEYPAHQVRIGGKGGVKSAHLIRDGSQTLRCLESIQNALGRIGEKRRFLMVQREQLRQKYLGFRVLFGVLHHVP